MAVALKALFDKRKLALTRARLHAWWEGETFNEEAALAALEPTSGTDGAEDALFDPPVFTPPPRLAALALLWGESRIRPDCGALDHFDPTLLSLAGDGVLAVLGPGAMAPLAAVAAAHPGKIEAFEWREEVLDALKHGIAKAKLAERVSLTRVDIEAHVFTPGAFDALISVDDFAYCSFPPHLAQQIFKCLKPGARALIEAYVGFKSAELATAFATSFAEPHIRAHGDLLQVLADTGLKLESDEDLTDAFLEAARQGFKQLSERLSEAEGLDVLAARELAWEAEAWRVRMRLLAQRLLERRRVILTRPDETAAALEPEPEPVAEPTPAPQSERARVELDEESEAEREARARSTEFDDNGKHLEVLERVMRESNKKKG